MSTTTTDDGLTIVHKGRRDHRIGKGNVGANLVPSSRIGSVLLYRFSAGQRYTLRMDVADAYDLADALDALLAYAEKIGEG